MYKKIIAIFLLLSSCSNENEYSQLIIGTWKLFSVEGNKPVYQSTYSRDGNITSFYYKKPDKKYISKYKITGNVICSILLVTPTPQYTHVGYEECVEIKSLNESKLVTIDDNQEINTYVKEQ